MASLTSEERQQLHDSLNELLGDKYPFEHWKKLARAPGGEGFGRAEWKTCLLYTSPSPRD